MRLREFEGKQLFKKYGIRVPQGILITRNDSTIPATFPTVVKSQVPTSDRKAHGGIRVVRDGPSFRSAVSDLFSTSVSGFLPDVLLAETYIEHSKELYMSISFVDRGPVLAFSQDGGSGVDKAQTFAVDPTDGVGAKILNTCFAQYDESVKKELVRCAQSLWKIVEEEHAILAEINPLFLLADGTLVAGDAKVMLDDAVVKPGEKPFVVLDGDIGVIASGGGASMLCLDMLQDARGKPANYTEYSGNPPKEVVAALTKKVLSQPNLKGCWVVGGTANFTDLYETLSGFLEGLRSINPKPTYPIVVRRDGPRRAEAFELLRKTAHEEGFNLHLFGPETSMQESACVLVRLMKS